MKKLLVSLLLFTTLWANNSKLIEKNIKLLEAQQQLIEKQQNSIDHISECLDAKLTYKQKSYKVDVFCTIDNFAIDEKYQVVFDEPTKIDKSFEFIFKPELRERPYEVVVAYFKLGGSLYYDKQTDKITPDILLGVEFFSFDKIIPFYGLSMNGVIGTRTISASLGYQMIYTKFFNNTSILLGYSYNYFDREFYPSLGIALNF